MSRHRLAVLLLVGALCACTAPGGIEVSRGTPAPPATGAPKAMAGDTATADPTTPTTAPAEDAAECDGETLAGVGETIGGQMAAFAGDDYAAALEFATEGFRSAFDEERFRATIEQGFPLVRDNAGHEIRRCVAEGDRASALVLVTGRSGEQQALAYLLELEDGAWRIGGAQPLRRTDEQPSDAPVI